MTAYVTLSELRRSRPVNERRVRRLRDEMIRATRIYTLVELRKTLGLTQAELAKMIGIDQSGVSRIERGKFVQTEIGTLASYVDALGGQLEIRVKVKNKVVTLADSQVKIPTKKKSARSRREQRS